MKKSTKGAFAAGTAAVLLMGGAGTMAFWTADAEVDGVAVTAGELKIIEDDCDTAVWTFDEEEAEAGKTYDAASDLIVPGDVLTKTCSFEVQATGEHLRAELDVTNPALSGALAPNLTLVDTYTIGGDEVADGEITEQNDGDVVEVAIEVTFNGGSGNTTQTLGGALSAFELSLTQVHDAPPVVP